MGTFFLSAMTLTMVIAMWVFGFFLFDNVVLGSAISKKLRRWAERKFGENDV